MAPSLQSLPIEMIVMVFESLDNFIDVTALNRVARLFHHIWKLKASAITDAVLPCAILCFDNAQALLRAQTPADTQRDRHGQKGYEAALHRTKQFLSNQQTVTDAYNQWNDLGRLNSKDHAVKSYVLDHLVSDRAHCIRLARFRYTRCFYCLWTLTFFRKHPHSSTEALSPFSSLNDMEVLCLYEVANYRIWKAWSITTVSIPSLIPNLKYSLYNYGKAGRTVKSVCRERAATRKQQQQQEAPHSQIDQDQDQDKEPSSSSSSSTQTQTLLNLDDTVYLVRMPGPDADRSLARRSRKSTLYLQPIPAPRPNYKIYLRKQPNTDKPIHARRIRPWAVFFYEGPICD